MLLEKLFEKLSYANTVSLCSILATPPLVINVAIGVGVVHVGGEGAC